MTIRLSRLAFACVVVVAASFTGPSPALAGDPRIEGLLPHPFPVADPMVLGAPGSVKLPGVTTPVTSTPTRRPPASTAASTSAPASGPGTSTTSAPATGPEAPTPAVGGGDAPPPG